MRKIALLLATAATMGSLAVGGGIASADALTVQACYDNAKPYSKPAGHIYVPTNGGWFTTTSNCADINIKPYGNRTVRVCFNPSSGPDYCQPRFTTVTEGAWGVVATNVANGTKFKFDFLFPSAGSGFYAA